MNIRQPELLTADLRAQRDDNGLFILPIKGRIWIPNSGVPAKLRSVKVKAETDGQEWDVRGMGELRRVVEIGLFFPILHLAWMLSPQASQPQIHRRTASTWLTQL